jgi:translation initiation factor IF-1
VSSDKIIFEGTVESARGNGFFVVGVKTDTGVDEIMCQLSGKIRTKSIKVVEGDLVEIEVDPYDTKKGRIVYRKR